MSEPLQVRSRILEGIAKAKDSAGAAQNVQSSPMMKTPQSGGATTYTVLKSMSQRFLGQYITTLEKAKAHLESYAEELDALNKRLEKAGKTGMLRKAMGGDDIDSTLESVLETIDKLEAHERATLKRVSF